MRRQLFFLINLILLGYNSGRGLLTWNLLTTTAGTIVYQVLFIFSLFSFFFLGKFPFGWGGMYVLKSENVIVFSIVLIN